MTAAGLRSTLVLAVLVAGLGAWLYWVDSEPAGDGSLTEFALEERSLLDAMAISIRSQPDVQPIELHRSGHVFEIAEPLRDLASLAKVREIAAAWDTAQVAPAFQPEEVTDDLLRQTGLDAPRAEIRLTYPDRELHLEIGEEGPLGRDVYVRKGGVIYWASKALYTVLGGTVDDFRERRLFLQAQPELHTLTVVRRPESGEPSRLVLRQQQPGRYRLEAPISARAHLAQAESFVASVLGLAVGSFVEGNMMPQPEPDWLIMVEGQRGRESVRLWRQPNTMLLGFQEPRQLGFLIEDREYSRMFDVPAELLRSRLLIPMAPEDIAQIELDPGAPGRAAVLRRGTGGVMVLEQPLRSETDPTAVALILEALGELRAEEFIDAGEGDLADFGLEKGFFTVAVRGALDPRPVEVRLGREEGELCYAKRTDESWVVKVPVKAARDLRRTWPAVVEREVLRVPAINVVRLVYTAGGEVRSYAKGKGDAWELEGGTVDSEAAESALQALTHLDASRVLDPQELGDLGPGLAVELVGLQDVVFERLSVFRKDGETLVRVAGRDVVYELRDADAAVILALAPD